MSDRRPTSSSHSARPASGPGEEFGVELDWPEDELAPPSVELGTEGRPPGELFGRDDPESAAAAPEGSSEPDTAEAAESAGWPAHPDEEPWPEVRLGPGFEDDGSEVGDAGDEATGAPSTADAPEGDEEGLPPVPPTAGAWQTAVVSPSGASVPAARPEALQGALTTLAMRIDALVGATSSNRSSIAERLNDHIDTVGRLARSQIADLAEFQHANERALGDVRRSLQGTEDLLRRVADRLERLQGDVDSLQGGLSEVRDAHKRLPEVADAITRLESSIELVPVEEVEAEPAADRLDDLRSELLAATGDQSDTQAELARQVEGLRAALEALSEVPDEPAVEGPSDLESAVARLEERLGEIASATPVQELAEGFQRLEERVGELGGQGHDPELHASIARLEDRLEALADAAPSPRQPPELADPSLGTRLDQLQEQLIDLGERLPAADLPDRFERLETLLAPAQPDSDPIAELREEVRALRRTMEGALAEPPAPADAPDADVAGLLAAVQKELATLRRRISVRAKPVEVQLDEEQADALADAVVARLRLMLEVVSDGDEHGG